MIKPKNADSREDIITLGAGHSILVGYKPKSIPSQEFTDKYFQSTKVKDTINSFGLFSSDIDYNTYYPDVTPEEFTPKEEEFIEPTYRLLSECIVSKNWLPTDFSKPGVLKAAMNLLVGQTVNCDHETNIGNAIGAVKEVVWQDSYQMGDIIVPAGINGVLKIDAKANPRIARGIMMDPPSVHSNSVTVRFNWEKSHPEMDDYDFWDKLGTYDKDGQMVRRVVTKIISFNETSLVSHGADPFAQKVDGDGKIVNPEYADRNYASFSEVNPNRGSYIFMDFKEPSSILHNTIHSFNDNKHKQNPNSNPEGSKNNNQMNEDLREFIESLFGNGMLSLSDGKEMNAETVLALIKQNSSELVSLRESLSQKDTEIASLKETIETNKPMVDLGTAHLSEVRSTTLESYKKLNGDKTDEAIISLIGTANLDVLTSLGKSYTAQLEEKYPITCSECGSHSVSRASSSNEDTTENDDTAGSPLSTQDSLSILSRAKLSTKKD